MLQFGKLDSGKGGEGMGLVFIVIPAEGDSSEVEIWYIDVLKTHYRRKYHTEIEVLVFEHDNSAEAVKYGIAVSTQIRVREFINKHKFGRAEIHAQAGLGSYVAYEFLRYCELQNEPGFCGRKISLTNVFMIGGAPSDAMTWAARWFRRYFSYFWYHIRWLVPFFADDPPNPECQEEIDKIKAVSTRVMRANPELYRDQLAFLGYWCIPDDWRVPDGVKVWFVPNGEVLRSKLRDNTYDDLVARACWEKHEVKITAQPGKNFSLYSMMPAKALFKVMDEVR